MQKGRLITLISFGLSALFLGRKALAIGNLRDKVVLITGGTSGLGYILARQFAREDCKVAICAQNPEELERAANKLRESGADVLTLECDVSDSEEVKEMVDGVINRFGQLDILVNNAGIMMVGPMDSFRKEDYEKAMNVMYWGMANTSFETIRHMKKRGAGQIVNITSIGGEVSIPHLLPYSASKFAALGFSEGMAAELAKDGIKVTTVIPGLMRTGSFVNAKFNRGDAKEFKLFSTLASAPVLTLPVEKAARRIVRAVKEKKGRVVLGMPARFMIQFHNLFPNITSRLFRLVASGLPNSHETSLESGREIESRSKSEHFGFGKEGLRNQRKYQDLEP